MKKNDLRHLSRTELVDLLNKVVQSGDASGLPSSQEAAAEQIRLHDRNRIVRLVTRTMTALLAIAAIAVLISSMFLPVIQVSGGGMEPQFHNGDVVLLKKTARFEKGELYCIAWQNALLVRRVIAGPGEIVALDEEGNVYVNGTLQDEPYVTSKSLGECDIEFPYTVPEGQWFLLGDQRDSAIDSRSTAIGCVKEDQIVGAVLWRILPRS